MAVKQVSVIQPCNQALGLNCDVVVCLAAGWEEKTVDGSRLVAGKAVAINKLTTTSTKCGCIGITSKTEACEVVLIIDDAQFIADEETLIVPFPEAEDVISAFPYPCLVESLKQFVVTTQVSDDPQNLINLLPDGILVPHSTIVTEYHSSGDQAAFPISATVTITNPSTYLPMRVLGNIHFWGKFTAVADPTTRFVTRDLKVDSVSAFGSPEAVGFIPTATSSAMNTGFEWFEDIGVMTFLDDDATLLDPGESKTYLVEFDGTLVGGDTALVNCQISLTGINYAPL